MDSNRPSSLGRLSLPKQRLRRSGILVLLGTAILAAVSLASTRLGAVCTDGGYCLLRPQLEKSDFLLQARPHPSRANGTRQIQANLERPECDFFPNTTNVLLVMKTGASEAYAKVPTLLLTNLRCLDDFLIFSDMKQIIGGHQIHDSLDTVVPEAKNNNPDFALYERQQKCPMDQESCNKYVDVAAQGWALDKYKNIHVAEKTYALRPAYDWYIFVDADSYVVWPTLMSWLARFDPRKKHYIGSASSLEGFPFAHGGSGYLVSQGAMRAFFQGKSGVASKYDVAAKSTCCGDALFSRALKEQTDITVKNVWPTVNGEQPYTLSFSARQWCQPIVTMHHIGSQVISMFDAFESQRNFSSPLRIKDIFHQFIEDEIPKTQVDWDNMSRDVYYVDPKVAPAGSWNIARLKTEGLNEMEKKAHASLEHCNATCRSLSNCLQYLYRPGVCSLSTKIKHGQPKRPDPGSKAGDRWMSGWDLERIEAWVRDYDRECGEIVWPTG